MPQLDKLIVLVQYKIFLILFLLVYFLFVFFILPRIYVTMNLRRKTLENFSLFYSISKSKQIFILNEQKLFFNNIISSFENFLSLDSTQKKIVLIYFFSLLIRFVDFK